MRGQVGPARAPCELARLSDLQLLDLGLLLHGLFASGKRDRDCLDTHVFARHESKLLNLCRSPSLPVSFKLLGHAVARYRCSGAGPAVWKTMRAERIIAHSSSAPRRSEGGSQGSLRPVRGRMRPLCSIAQKLLMKIKSRVGFRRSWNGALGGVPSTRESWSSLSMNRLDANGRTRTVGRDAASSNAAR